MPSPPRRLQRTLSHLAPVEIQQLASAGQFREPATTAAAGLRGPPLSHVAGNISAEELAAQSVAPSKLKTMTQDFARDGYCIVTGLFEPAFLDTIEQKLDNDAAHQLLKHVLLDRQSGEATQHAQTRHLANGLPRTAPWVYPEIVASPVVEQLVAALLGGAAFIRYYNGNTSLPDDPAEPTGEQGLHMDGGGWSVNNAEEAAEHNLPFPPPPLKLFLNFGTDTMSPENGSTEVRELTAGF